MPACLLFDLFGTLVEYEPARTRAELDASLLLVERMVPDRAGTITPPSLSSIWDAAFAILESRAASEGREFHMDEVSRQVAETLDLPADAEAASQLSRAYIADWSRAVTPVPGAPGMVRSLSAHYRVGLISNTHYPPMVKSLVSDMQLDETFEVVVTSAEVGVPKPDPRIFEAALSAMDVAPADAIYVGDNYEHDYRGATELGMSCYLIGKHARVPRTRRLRSILDLAIHLDPALQS